MIFQASALEDQRTFFMTCTTNQLTGSPCSTQKVQSWFYTAEALARRRERSHLQVGSHHLQVRSTERSHCWAPRVLGQVQTGYKEEIFYREGGEALAQVAQRGGRCPIPGNIPGQVGRGSEQPDLVEGVPAHCRGVGLDGLQRSLPAQTIP